MYSKIIPEPKHLQISDGSFKFNPDTVIVLSAKGQPYEYALAKQLKHKLVKFVGVEVVIEKHFSPYEIENRVFLLIPDRDSEIFSPQALAYPEDISELGAQGYFLKVSTKNIVIAASSQDGLFYGAQTLSQIARQHILVHCVELGGVVVGGKVVALAGITQLSDDPRHLA